MRSIDRFSRRSRVLLKCLIDLAGLCDIGLFLRPFCKGLAKLATTEAACTALLTELVAVRPETPIGSAVLRRAVSTAVFDVLTTKATEDEADQLDPELLNVLALANQSETGLFADLTAGKTETTQMQRVVNAVISVCCFLCDEDFD